MYYKTYYESLIRPCLLSKYNYINAHDVLTIKECKLTICFSNDNIEEDMRVLQAVCLLELLGGKKPFVRKISGLYRAKTKTTAFVLSLSLRNEAIFNFLQLFSLVAIPNFALRYLQRNLDIDKKAFGYYSSFRDMNIFISMPEIYYKWDFLLNSSLTLRKIHKFISITEVEDFYKFFFLNIDFATLTKNGFENDIEDLKGRISTLAGQYTIHDDESVECFSEFADIITTFEKIQGKI